MKFDQVYLIRAAFAFGCLTSWAYAQNPTPPVRSGCPTRPATNTARKSFVHPGLLNTGADFERMRAKVNAGQSPWIDGWNQLIASPQAQAGWKAQPLETVVRGGKGQNFPQLFNDVHAAYQLALRWKISGDEVYAAKAIEILNTWSARLKSIIGNGDRFLAAGIYGYQFANAAEIMRTFPGWQRQDFSRFQAMMLRVFYPMNRDFLSRHNDAAITNYWANWDLCNVAAMQAIGVLCDRRDVYDEAMAYFATGKGNGTFDKSVYYVHDGNLGQWQESGRDQGHSTLGIALMGPIMESAWNQGEDWYSRDNNRFLAGAEYVAKYNLGEDVPFEWYAHGVGQKGVPESQSAVSPAGRPSFRVGYEIVFNHYVNRQGIAAPYSTKYAAQMRPERGGGGHASTFDQLGFGTLTATRDPEATDSKPSGLTVQKRAGKAVLSWWGAAGMESYDVKRANTSGGPYTVVAKAVSESLSFTDETIPQAGKYFYVVTGRRGDKETDPSNEVQFLVGPVLRTHLKFDEDGGDIVYNEVERAASGILPNGGGRTNGRIGRAVSLDGSKQYVALPIGVVSRLSDFTVAAWINLETAPAWVRIFDFGDDRGQWMFLTPNAGNGLPRFEVSTVYGYNAQRIEGNAPLPVKKWVHVAVTLSGQQGTLYVDGVPVGNNPTVDFPPFRLGITPRNWIGCSQSERDPHLNGKIDDFRIYDGALPPTEIANLARTGSPL